MVARLFEMQIPGVDVAEGVKIGIGEEGSRKFEFQRLKIRKTKVVFLNPEAVPVSLPDAQLRRFSKGGTRITYSRCF